MGKGIKIIRELDSQTGNLLLRLETLKTIGQELNYLREDIEETSQKEDLTSKAIHYVHVEHKIKLIDDLFNYCVEELEKDYEEVEESRSTLHNLFVESSKKGAY